MTEAEEHLRADQLFPLIWAHRDDAPPDEGEGADPELSRMFRDLDERFREDLPMDQRLGPDTSKRLWEHALACAQCRLLLVEDGPSSRRKATAEEVAAAEQKFVDERKQKVVKFWIDITVGTGTFLGAFVCMQKIRSKEAQQIEGSALQADPRDISKQIDPLWFGFVIFVLVASWFLAEAYALAKDLWIDFTAWKRAVPVIGQRWAEKSKQNKGR